MPKKPIWLNDEEQATWRAYLAANAQLEESFDRQLQRQAGLPHTYYTILAMLSEADGHRMRMQELAKLTSASQSRLSHAVSRLEESGWVVREKATSDRRGTFVLLSSSGLEKVRETAPGHVAEVRKRLFDALTPEQVLQLHAIAKAITAANES